MKHSTIKKAVNFFYPFLTEDANIFFYGGEPLLCFDGIEYAVSLLRERNKEKEKKLKCAVSTNGSLLDERMLDFFDRHGFSLQLSFDGLTQDTARNPGSLAHTGELLQRLQGEAYPGIGFRVNSVFSPENVEHLSQSIQYIIESGGTEIKLSLASDRCWDEAAQLRLEKEIDGLTAYLVSYYRQHGSIPVIDFRGSNDPAQVSPEGKGVFVCDAGRNRMAVTPGEDLWGCYKFHGYSRVKPGSSDLSNYSMGKLDDFMENHERILSSVLGNYALLRQNFFYSDRRYCFLCKELSGCGFCPVHAAYSTSVIGKFPHWMCRLQGIRSRFSSCFDKRFTAEGAEGAERKF